MAPLDLNLIAARLEGLEETIIHRLIDRAQFARNDHAYETSRSGFDGATAESLFDLRLRYQEEMDALFGRFEVPEERPFHDDLPAPRREVHLPDSPLRVASYASISLTAKIVSRYLAFLPELTKDDPEDDGQYGSSVEHDVLAIQAIARRVHYGALYVAEAKYSEAPGEMRRLIDARDQAALEQRITRPEVEQRILARVAEKVAYVQASINTAVRRRIDPAVVLEIYRTVIIPFTKEGEIRYLFERDR